MITLKDKMVEIVKEKNVRIEVSRMEDSWLPYTPLFGVIITNLSNGKELLNYTQYTQMFTIDEIMNRWIKRVINL